jgi:hypothetical protein
MIKLNFRIISLSLALSSLAVEASLMAQSQDTVYVQSGGTGVKTNQTYSAISANTSGVLVSNSGTFTLTNSSITTTGNSSSTDSSSQYGLNAGVFAKSAGVIVMSGCSVTTSGTGANALFATGSMSSITMTNGSIVCSGGNAHGVDVTYTGSITLINVNVTTSGASSSALATDFGGGTVTVTGGTIKASANHSAGIYSTGAITVSGADITASGDNGAVIDADGSIVIVNTSLTGDQNGLMVHNTVGQASLMGTYTMTGGSLTAQGGDGFYVTAAKALITVNGGGVINASTGVIVNAVSSSTVAFVSDGDTLAGNLNTSGGSTIIAALKNSSRLSGAINSAALTLDASSVWVVTGTSIVTGLTDADGISGTSIMNIIGNGNSVYYDSRLTGNKALAGKTYSLLNGGQLTPGTTTGVANAQQAIPSTWRLDQNYPNPFNPSTTIGYNLPVESHVRIQIINDLGARVASLFEGEQAAGYQKVSWNAKVSSGVYFYHIEAVSTTDPTNRFVQVKRMLLMK